MDNENKNVILGFIKTTFIALLFGLAIFTATMQTEQVYTTCTTHAEQIIDNGIKYAQNHGGEVPLDYMASRAAAQYPDVTDGRGLYCVMTAIEHDNRMIVDYPYAVIYP